MKRDMDLVRKLLIFFDEKVGPELVENPLSPEYGTSEIQYHLVLLYQAGFLSCEPVKSSTSERVIKVLPFELTWAGHEFLSKIRPQMIWDEVKREVQNKGIISASVSLLKRLADSALRRHMGLA